MRGGLLKSSKSNFVRKKRPPHAETVRDVKRKIASKAYQPFNPKAGISKPTKSQNLDKMIQRGGRGLLKITGPNYSYEEARALEASLKIIQSGKTSGTLPERLVAQWLIGNGYRYGGMGYYFDGRPNSWGFQVPIGGGRSSAGGGSVVDIFLGPAISGTPRGVALRVNGAHWHLPAANQLKDEVERLKMVSLGYRVTDIWDYEALNSGALEQKMSLLLSIGFR